jgi:hypothetical protein
VVDAALRAWERLAPGVARKDVEAAFELDGGLQTLRSSRYALRACRSIKIDVQFTIEGDRDPIELLATDIVEEISRPYLELPFTD